MSNYFRATAYNYKKDFCMIMDTYGRFEKKWQFSADLVKRGYNILEISDMDQVEDGNIPRLTEPTDKFVLQAYAFGKPTYEDGYVKVDNKYYKP